MPHGAYSGHRLPTLVLFVSRCYQTSLLRNGFDLSLIASASGIPLVQHECILGCAKIPAMPPRADIPERNDLLALGVTPRKSPTSRPLRRASNAATSIYIRTRAYRTRCPRIRLPKWEACRPPRARSGDIFGLEARSGWDAGYFPVRPGAFVLHNSHRRRSNPPARRKRNARGPCKQGVSGSKAGPQKRRPTSTLYDLGQARSRGGSVVDRRGRACAGKVAGDAR